jgi:single-stranded-DNA-specific exonuclease
VRPFLGVSTSATGRAWRARLGLAGEAAAEALVSQFGAPDALARVLAGRGTTPQTYEDDVEPQIRRLMPDPSILTGMESAAARLADAVEQRERVALFGDYDVDGATSSALLALYLRHFGLDVAIHIPDRITEGYGPNIPAIEGFKRDSYQLLVMLDCGTTSFAPLKRAAELKLPALVIDHHLAEPELPEAIAIVNPNRQDDLSGLGHLCAAGVAFMTLVALNRELRRRGAFVSIKEPDLLGMLDLVALGTVADVVPLIGLNRAFVARGLDVMRRRERIGMTALADIARIGGPPEPYHLGFLIGPRINAGGRIGDAALGARLLTSTDPDEAASIAETLDRLNRERQVIEKATLDEAYGSLATLDTSADSPAVIVTYGEGWHPGVVGLVAARVKERFSRPALAIAFDGDTGTGSARSIVGVDLGRAVRKAVAEGLLIKGGGHVMAAGLTIKRDRLDALSAFLEAELSASVVAARSERTLDIDAVSTASAATPDLVQLLAKAGPFGSGRPEPIIAFAQHRVTYASVVGENHVRLTLEDQQRGQLKAIAFRAAEEPLGRALLAARGRTLTLAGSLSLDRWQGTESVQLRVIDVAV